MGSMTIKFICLFAICLIAFSSYVCAKPFPEKEDEKSSSSEEEKTEAFYDDTSSTVSSTTVG